MKSLNTHQTSLIWEIRFWLENGGIEEHGWKYTVILSRMHLTYDRMGSSSKASGFRLGLLTNINTKDYCDFPQFFQADSGIVLRTEDSR